MEAREAHVPQDFSTRGKLLLTKVYEPPSPRFTNLLAWPLLIPADSLVRETTRRDHVSVDVDRHGRRAALPRFLREKGSSISTRPLEKCDFAMRCNEKRINIAWSRWKSLRASDSGLNTYFIAAARNKYSPRERKRIKRLYTVAVVERLGEAAPSARK